MASRSYGNEGHESAVFHVFQTEDETGQFAVGRQISSEPYQAAGEQVVRGDRQFTVVEYTREIRVVEDLGGDIRVEVVSSTLDAETLIPIAESVISHLTAQLGAQVKVTLEIEAQIPNGAPETIVRTVTENSRTLKFNNHGFESD